MNNLLTFKCTTKFDPCFGYKIIQPGQTIEVLYSNQYGIEIWSIMSCSNNDQYFGYKIYNNDFSSHFKKE